MAGEGGGEASDDTRTADMKPFAMASADEVNGYMLVSALSSEVMAGHTD